jgi:ABC-type nitrate/sulfonate/bicarbonate transport system permease component
MESVKRFYDRYLLGITSTVIWLVGWFLLTTDGFGVISELDFPSPVMVVKSVFRISPGLIATHILVTSARMITGWAVGVALGVGMGLAMSYSRTIFKLFDPLIESFRPVPVIAVIPFFILWFGIRWQGKFLMIALGCFMIMVVSTVEAVRNVRPIYIRAAQSLGADKRKLFKTVVFPAIQPELVSGLRISAALAWTLVVASEFMGAQTGLGYMIMNARRTLNTDVIFLGCILFGLLSTVLDQALRRGTNYVTRWAERM